jgi:hypothetical protein
MRLASLATRNDALVARVRELLGGDDAAFQTFARHSSAYRDGSETAATYLAKVTAMGVDASCVDELAALMPDEEKRSALQRAAAAAERARNRSGGGGGGGGGGGASVDQAAALLFGAGAGASEWDCASCTFRNPASNARCDVCDSPKISIAGGGGGGGNGGSSAGGAATATTTATATANERPGGGKKKGRKGRGTTISLTAVGGAGGVELDEMMNPNGRRNAWG